LINLRSVKLVARLSEFGVAWHIAGVATIALLLTFAGRYHNGLGFLLSGSHPGNPAAIRTFQIGPLTFHSILVHVPGLRSLYEAGGYGFCFVLGLLQAQWTYTGYDASAHLAEETLLARLNSAWGIFLSVAVSAVAGYILLIALTNSIPPNQILEIATNPYPVLYIARRALAPFLANVVGVFFFQAKDGIRDWSVTGVQTCALPISLRGARGLRTGPPSAARPRLADLARGARRTRHRRTETDRHDGRHQGRTRRRGRDHRGHG